MPARFYVNTLLTALVPGGWGYPRKLRKMLDPGFDPKRDLAPSRSKHFGHEGWKEKQNAQGFKYRNYSSYEEYKEHQGSKFDEILRLYGGFSRRVLLRYRFQFFDRFKNLPKILPLSAKMLCCGARQGTEVEVLREIGFVNAFGIDLNPGPANPYVTEGDFLALKAKDGELDFIYSNAVDHAFDLDQMFREHARAVRPGGYVMYDIAIQEGGAFEAVHWETDEDVFRLLLKHFKRVEMVRIDKGRKWKTVLLQR